MNKPKNAKTISQLNERNNKYWEKLNEKINRFIEKYPEEVTHASEIVAHTIQGDRLHHIKMLEESSLPRQLEKAIERESGRNQARAQKPRSDHLAIRIQEIVLIKPDISLKDLFSQLESEKGISPIIEVTREGVSFKGKTAKEEGFATVDNLRTRLSRAKKQLKTKKGN
ncbi:MULTISPECIES: hypothetical protein [unclassified Polynucleobacter]|uniref:hypothetical protein n=1 Tax=unclassified Polynucleobacter TaxID=2640945 RepID=UPI0025FD769D|nr:MULTISPECIES: hypothetical protein [unclassified Polynucleobacter]